MSKDERHHVTRRGPHRDVHGQLTPPLPDGEGHDAVQSDHREAEPQHADRRRDTGAVLERQQLASERFVEWRDTEWKIRIELLRDVAERALRLRNAAV